MHRTEKKTMSKSRVDPSSEKPTDILTIFTRLVLLSCLAASIFILYCSSSTRSTRSTQWFPYPSPPIQNYRPEPEDPSPTNISHIVFGLGGSAKTWPDRGRYSSLWWDPSSTRGFVWLDKKPGKQTGSGPTIPYRISGDWTRFMFSKPAVRIARIVLESFNLGLPNVRWFVMGDDDTVYFTDNLVSVLAKYDHNQMYYIGGSSESVEQDVMHSYDMAFGGGGFAISYGLAVQLVKILDGCLDRYFYFYGSDQRIWACVNELGVGLTKERGFHQFDIRGDPSGFLSAHPLTPLVSLHHLDYLHSIFPNQTQIASLTSLFRAYRVDPARIIQQTFCYDRTRGRSISVAWGYAVQIYPALVAANELQMPLQTFKTWRSSSDGPFEFNVRPVEPDPCRRPEVYFMERVEEVRKEGSLSFYKRFVGEGREKCKGGENALKEIVVSSMKMDPRLWKKVPPRRQCCEIMEGGSKKNNSMRIRIRKCRASETITI